MKMFVLSLALAVTPLFAQEPGPVPTAPPVSAPSAKLIPGARVFIEPMDGFETSLTAAILEKQTPVRVVDERAKADFILTGYSKVEKAGWAKTIFVSPKSHAEASIEIKDAHTGDMVWAYNVDKSNSARGAQSTAEACAKHLKQFIEKNEKAK